MKKLKAFLSVLLAAVISLSVSVPCFAASDGFEFLQYPAEAITDFRPEILSRISSGDDYIANQGYDETGLYISPYWTMTVNNKAVPVYATAVYDWVLDTGVVQSFQYIFTDGETELEINMSFSGGRIKNFNMLPESLNGGAYISGNRLSAQIKDTGAYTFLINGDSQEYAITLFVRENKNENAEIKKLTEKYGENNISVYESGYYQLDTLPTDKDCIYFKRGSFVSFLHKNDIRSDADADNSVLGSVMELNGKENAVVTGCGTFDFTKIDRRERNLVNVNFCKNTTVEGLILLNPNSWTVTAYGSEDCTLNDITVFGYRTNSDGINICGCNNITVSNSFCRNGDDCFSAKATNTNYECHDITYKNCIGWSNKARCFGITGEVERDIYNITFSDCAVIYRNATWDMDRTASLAIAVETGNGNVYNVLFENIEIHKDTGRPIYCMVYGDGINGCQISGVRFRNLSINADEKIKISSQREMSLFGKFCAGLNNTFLGRLKKLSAFFGKFYNASNSVSVSFENVKINNKALNRKKIKFIETFGNTEITFDKR